MNNDAGNVLYRSGKTFYLSSLSSGMKVLKGELNLFLVRCDANGLAEKREFLVVLKVGDTLCPESSISVDGIRYELTGEPSGDVLLAPSEVSRTEWQSSLQAAVSEIAVTRVNAESVPKLLAVLVGILNEQNEKRLQHNRENREFTSDALGRKLNGLGHIAGVRSTYRNREEKSDYLTDALRNIAQFYHLPFEKESELLLNRESSVRERLKMFAVSAGWRIRRIELTQDYYKQSARPVLAFRRDNDSPVILYLSANGSSYCDPAYGSRKYPLNRKSASLFSGDAYCFYEPFPPGKKSKKALLKFVFATARPVLTLIVAAGVISSLIGLIMPVATRYITGEVIPTANLPELWQLLFLLIVLNACAIGLNVVPSLVMMLFSAQQYERFQAAVYDHVLRIPVQTFKMCDSGDMTQRILGASQIQASVFGIISQQFIGSLFSLVSLIMMFYYSPLLGAIGLIMVLIYAGFFFLLSRINLHPLAVKSAASGRMSGLMKQFFDGMAKIRAAGAEQQILSRFTDDFSEMVRQNYIISRNGAYQSVFLSIFPMLISVLFYALAGGFLDKNLTLPVFLAFMAAFQSFQGGLLGLASGCWALLAIKPELDRIMPILEATPEDDGKRRAPGKLDGKVEVSHLNFRYSPDAPLVLKDVSFHAMPGEFIAIVGPSGAGKSSLVRLLLGFEQPENGAVFYSGKDLANLELRSVRRQLGVILQNSKILPGSILENIITGTEYTIQDAWHALELAAFKQEVENMPMGIHTLVMPENISGGQQQRILIARALVGKPSIVVMDESTSALDNLSQEIVKENMGKLHTTRIVIAHRLSTVIRADRIYVLDKGMVVQQGTYAELSEKEGMFRNLVERQLTERT